MRNSTKYLKTNREQLSEANNIDTVIKKKIIVL